jgi:ketosteroid isomerase-like protein
MVSEDAVERLRRGYAAYNRGDSVELLSTLTEDFEARDRAELPDPQVHHGTEGAKAALAAARAEFDDYVVEPYEFIPFDECIVVCARQRGRGHASGVAVEGEIFHLWKLRGDRVAGLYAFSTREEALEAAGGGLWSRRSAAG